MRQLLVILFICVFSNVVAQKLKTKKSVHNVVLKSTKTRYNFSANLLEMPTFIKVKVSNVEVGFNVPILKDAQKKRFTIGANIGYNTMKENGYVTPNISYNMPVYHDFSIKYKAGTSIDVVKNISKENSKINYSYNPEFISSIGVEPNVKVYQNKNYNVNVFMRYEFATSSALSAFGQLMHVGLNVQSTEANTAK